MSNKNDPNTININVADTVGTKDSMGNGKSRNELKIEMEKLYATEIKKAEKVLPADIPDLLEATKVMFKMCAVGRGGYDTASSIAHTQMKSEKHLNFFVTSGGEAIVNPIVVSSPDKQIITILTGSLTYPDREKIQVVRYNTIVVKYRIIEKKEEEFVFSPIIERTLKDNAAFLFQDMVHLLKGHDIYKKEDTLNNLMN